MYITCKRLSCVHHSLNIHPPQAKAQLQRDKIQEEKAVKLQKIKIKEEQVKDLQVCTKRSFTVVPLCTLFFIMISLNHSLYL